jgi:hypothetical protein
MITKTIKNWNDLVREVFEDSYIPEIQRYRSPYAFRGQSGDYPLMSSLMRLGHSPEKVSNFERYIFDNFRKYAHKEFQGEGSEWRWLSYAQHHGLPTRLLDWSFSPFVAMHFATSDLSTMNKDGVLWCIDLFKTQNYLPEKLKEAISERSVGVFSIEMLEKHFKQIDEFDTQEKGQNFVLFFEPPSLDQRIISQVALFSFMSDPSVSLDDWVRDEDGKPVTNSDNHVAKKLIIKSDAKWEIRDKLDQLNINERVLFPGPDGLSDWLKRWYTLKK